MINKENVLVTGACGVTSRSVVRSLMESKFFKEKFNFIGTDVCNNLYAAFEGLYKRVYKVPPFNHPDYRRTIEDIIQKEKIKYAVVIPEPEVLYWCENPFNVKFHIIPPRFAKSVLSKLSLYNILKDTDLIPKYQIVSSNPDKESISLPFPMWIRDYSEGTTSGLGSFLAENFETLQSWLKINEGKHEFMLSEFLPGRNLACFLLFNNGELLKYGVAERIDYIMSKVSVSGITGNTSRGKLLNYEEAFQIAKKAVDKVIETTEEPMNGLVVVDMKEDRTGHPKVTEINIRHVAFTSSFAKAGLNFAETQFLILTDQEHLISHNKTKDFTPNNIILRDVDGLPIYLENFQEVEMGDYYRNQS